MGLFCWWVLMVFGVPISWATEITSHYTSIEAGEDTAAFCA